MRKVIVAGCCAAILSLTAGAASALTTVTSGQSLSKASSSMDAYALAKKKAKKKSAGKMSKMSKMKK